MKKLYLLIVALAVFITIINPVFAPAPGLRISHVKSTDSAGNEQDYFLPNEDVWCIIMTTGTGSLTVDVYIVYNDEWQPTGQVTMTDRSGGYETFTLTVAANGPGGGQPTTHGPFLIWSDPLTPGSYDIVVDENQNAIRDPGESVDNSDVLPGFFVVPEIQGSLITLALAFAAAMVIKTKRLPLKL